MIQTEKKKTKPKTGIYAGATAFILILISAAAPWWSWHGNLWLLYTPDNVQASVVVYLWGMAVTLSSGGYSLSRFTNWGGLSPEAVATKNLEAAFGLLIFAALLVIVGVSVAWVSVNKGTREGTRMASLLFGLGSFLCLLAPVIFLSQLTSGGNSNALGGNFEFTSYWVRIHVDMQWGISIGPLLSGVSSLIGFVAAYATNRARIPYEGNRTWSRKKPVNG